MTDNAMSRANETAREKALDLLKPSTADLEHGLELHRESLVVDSFGFAPYALTRRMIEAINELNDQGVSADDLRDKLLEMRVCEVVSDPEAREQYVTAWRDSGVTGTMQTCGGATPFDKMVRHFSRFFYIWDHLPEVTQKAIRSDDVRQAKAEGRHCQFISLNGLPGAHIQNGPDEGLKMVDNCYRMGCRMMHLTYNLRNLIGDGCVEPADAGLSGWGQEVVERMNQVGILVDTPHSGKQTTLDAARASTAPVAASHTAAQSVYFHDRGKSDEEIKAIAETGGFIGVCAIPYFLAEWGTIVSLIDHVEYLTKLVGVDHVTIGTDVACTAHDPEGIELKPIPAAAAKKRNWRPEHLPKNPEVHNECRTGSLRWTNWPLFTVGLVQRGYSDVDIQKIIGGNVLRVLDEVARCTGPGGRA